MKGLDQVLYNEPLTSQHTSPLWRVVSLNMHVDLLRHWLICLVAPNLRKRVEGGFGLRLKTLPRNKEIRLRGVVYVYRDKSCYC